MIIIGQANLKDVSLDFGMVDPRYDINGLLGLVLLVKLGAVVDTKKL
jgi:hypothetical protein